MIRHVKGASFTILAVGLLLTYAEWQAETLSGFWSVWRCGGLVGLGIGAIASDVTLGLARETVKEMEQRVEALLAREEKR